MDPVVHEFINNNLALERLRAMVIFFLNNQELIRMVLGLTPEDQERFVHRVDQVRRGRCHVLRSTSSLIALTKVLPTVDTESVKLVEALGAICSATEHLPSSAVLSEGLKKSGNTPVTSAGLMDTSRGEYGHRPVSINALRNYPAQYLGRVKKVRVICVTSRSPDWMYSQVLWTRVPMWIRLSHPNVLPFRGVNMTLSQLALVYDWGENGNIIQYVMSHPGASRTRLVRTAISTVKSKLVTNWTLVR